MIQQTQIGFQRNYDGRCTPVYRTGPDAHWIPTAQHSIAAPKDVATPEYAKWQALFKAGAKVVGGELK